MQWCEIIPNLPRFIHFLHKFSSLTSRFKSFFYLKFHRSRMQISMMWVINGAMLMHWKHKQKQMLTMKCKWSAWFQFGNGRKRDLILQLHKTENAVKGEWSGEEYKSQNNSYIGANQHKQQCSNIWFFFHLLFKEQIADDFSWHFHSVSWMYEFCIRMRFCVGKCLHKHLTYYEYVCIFYKGEFGFIA